MEVTFWGHNCFTISQGTTTILIDPWFSKKGAFFGSWHPWPSNYDQLDVLKAKLTGQTVYVYLSHEHQDHFDLETLSDLAGLCVRALVPLYHDRFLVEKTKAVGFDVTEVADSDEFEIAKGFTLMPMIVDTGVNHDSAVLIKTVDAVFLNQNDCKIYDRILALKEKVDYYAVQFSGATWHPACYSYDNVEKADISRKKVKSKLMAIRQVVRKLQPKYFLPSAGPAVFPFLDPAMCIGEDSIFVHQDILPPLFVRDETRPVFLRPGEVFDPTKVDPILAPTQAEVTALRQTLPQVWDDLRVDFDPSRLLATVTARLDEIKGFDLEQCPELVLRWGEADEDAIIVDLNTKTATISNKPDHEDHVYYLTADKTYFGLMSDDGVRWQDLALTFRARLHRVPDVFNTFINIFLSSDVSNIKKAFETTLNISEERIVRRVAEDGPLVEFNRYCPHNGADLIDAEIDGQGNLICPRHAWKFNLRDEGNCPENAATLHAVEVEKTITLCETIHARLVKPTT